MAEINAALEDGMAQRITTLQSNLIARASIDSMKTSGSFSFEKMSNTETMETLNTMARAAGMRLVEGASPNNVDPNISPNLSLGQISALPKAATHRMQIAELEGNTSPFASNAYRVSLAKSKTLIRYVEGKIGINELLEETVETHLDNHFKQTGTTPQWAAEHLRKAQTLLRQQGTIKHDLITPEGDVTHMQVIEAMGTLAQADFLHRIDSLSLPEFIKDFIKWARSIISQAAHLANLGKAIRELDAAGKLDKTFTQVIYDAAGITQQFWKDAAIDSTHQTLARIATAAIAPLQTKLTTNQDITNGAYKAWLSTTTLKDEEATAPPTNNTTTDIQASFSITPQDNEQWNKQLDDYFDSKTINPLHHLTIGEAPTILIALGYEKRNIVISPGTLNKIMVDKHSLAENEVRNLAQAIYNPILIIDSASESDSLVILTDIRNEKGSVIAAIHIDKKMTGGIYHKIASAYTKESGHMIINQIKNGHLRYIDKKRALAWARSFRLQLPNTSSQKGKASVLTPEDIVKWKNEHNEKSIPLSDFLKGDHTDSASFSVIGTHAKNWESIKHQAFTGRDDGMLRVELDASQAKITPNLTQRIQRRLDKDKSEKKVRFTLKNVLDYPALYQAYPKLANMSIVLANLGARGTHAWYNPKTKTMLRKENSYSIFSYEMLHLT